jgi:hypothetical protein
MPDMDVARLTSHFDRWQGLRWIPFALYASTAAAAVAARDTSVFLAVLVLGVAVAGIAEKRIDSYYGRTFGHVRALKATRIRNAVLRYGAIVPVAVAGVIDVHYHPPILITGVAAAVCLLVFWAVSGRGREQWPAAAGILILTAVAPLVNVVPTGASGLVAVLLVTAVAEVAGGLLDHRIFLTRVREARHDGLG